MPPALWFVAGEGMRKEKCAGFVGPLLFPYIFDVQAQFGHIYFPTCPDQPSPLVLLRSQALNYP